MRQNINTDKAPAAIGSYSQAIKVGNAVYLAGQIPLDPKTMALVEGDITQQVSRVFENMKAVVEAANGTLDDVVKLTVYLTDLADIVTVNEVIAHYFKQPYPARTSIQVSALPKGATVEIEGIMQK
ncbi:MAG: RidA family protein [Gammaproteobacteria bacterium]